MIKKVLLELTTLETHGTGSRRGWDLEGSNTTCAEVRGQVP